MTDDTPEMKQFCLDCPFDECWDCLGRNTAVTWAIKEALKNHVAIPPEALLWLKPKRRQADE